MDEFNLKTVGNLTESQFRILNILMKKQQFDKHSKPLGITSYELRERGGIPGRTFDINKEFLIKADLMAVIKTERAGKQLRTYYDITPLGYFFLLKTDQKETLKDPRNVTRFLSIFSNHVLELKNDCGILLDGIIKLTLEGLTAVIDITTQGNQKVVLSRPYFSIMVPTGNWYTQITISKDIAGMKKGSTNEIDLTNYGKNILSDFEILFFINGIMVTNFDESLTSLYYDYSVKPSDDESEEEFNRFLTGRRKINELFFQVIKKDNQLSIKVQKLIEDTLRELQLGEIVNIRNRISLN